MSNRHWIRFFMGLICPLLGFLLFALWLIYGNPYLLIEAVLFLGAPMLMPAPSKSKVSASRTPLERLADRYVEQEDPDWAEFERKVARLMKPARTPDHRYSDEDIRVQKMRTRREIREIHARNRKERGW